MQFTQERRQPKPGGGIVHWPRAKGKKIKAPKALTAWGLRRGYPVETLFFPIFSSGTTIRLILFSFSYNLNF